jgi:uncharacterized membrane protein
MGNFTICNLLLEQQSISSLQFEVSSRQFPVAVTLKDVILGAAVAVVYLSIGFCISN